jgi:hypothetical protein
VSSNENPSSFEAYGEEGGQTIEMRNRRSSFTTLPGRFQSDHASWCEFGQVGFLLRLPGGLISGFLALPRSRVRVSLGSRTILSRVVKNDFLLRISIV